MKRIACSIFILFFVATWVSQAHAYWIWTPKTGRWLNPKYAVKPTPKEQFDFAFKLFSQKAYPKAINEFKKLIQYFPRSKYAAEAQFHIALTHEELGEYEKAFRDYQKLIKKYPYTERINEAIEKEYRIGNLFFSGKKRKILKLINLPTADLAVEIFRAVVENAPYGKYADLAQYKIGLCLKKLARFDEAIEEFRHLYETYPESQLVEEAKFQSALCAFEVSSSKDYDASSIESALKELKDFRERYKESKSTKEAEKSIQQLEDRLAEKNFQIAKFYERQKDINSAIIYYKDILNNYPESIWAAKALERLEVLKRR